eukprot:g5438.t1
MAAAEEDDGTGEADMHYHKLIFTEATQYVLDIHSVSALRKFLSPVTPEIQKIVYKPKTKEIHALYLELDEMKQAGIYTREQKKKRSSTPEGRANGGAGSSSASKGNKCHYVFPCVVAKVASFARKSKPDAQTVNVADAQAKMVGKPFRFVVGADGLGLADDMDLVDRDSLREGRARFSHFWPYVDIIGWQIRGEGGTGLLFRVEYDVVVRFKGSTAHAVVDAIEAAVPVKQYVFRCRLASVGLDTGADKCLGFAHLRTIAGGQIKLVVDDHGIAITDSDAFAGREREVHHVHFDYSEIAGWIDEQQSLCVRIKESEVTFDEFKRHQKPHHVVEAIENIVEFKNRVKKKVVGVFHDEHKAASAGPSSETVETTMSWVPSVAEYEIYRDLFRLADSRGDGCITAPEAAAFLYRTRLPVFVLREIWTTVSRGRTEIGEDDFMVLLRLVTLAQNDYPHDEETLNNLADDVIPAPAIAGLPKNTHNDATFTLEPVP